MIGMCGLRRVGWQCAVETGVEMRMAYLVPLLPNAALVCVPQYICIHSNPSIHSTISRVISERVGSGSHRMPCLGVGTVGTARRS